MKWLLILLGVLVALGGICTLIGALRPRDHVARSQATFQAGREVLWEVLADFAAWPEWNSAFETVTQREPRDGKAFWVAKGSWGELPMVMETVERPKLLVTRIPEDAGIGFSGTWRYELEARPEGGTTLTVTERGSVSSPFFRFVMIFHDNHATQLRFLEDLAAHLKEEVHPKPLAEEEGLRKEPD